MIYLKSGTEEYDRVTHCLNSLRSVTDQMGALRIRASDALKRGSRSDEGCAIAINILGCLTEYRGMNSFPVMQLRNRLKILYEDEGEIGAADLALFISSTQELVATWNEKKDQVESLIGRLSQLK